MILPKRSKREKGQILIIFLLILVVTLAIVLSIASRTVMDVRMTSTSDESNRAYFAAEAGVEEALKQLEAGVAISAHPINLDFGKLNNTKGLVQEVGLGGEQNFIYPGNLKKDEVAQFNLLSIPDNPAPAPPEEPSPIGSSLTFHWGSSDTRADDAGAGPDTWKTAAIEVTIIYCNPCVAPPGTSTFRLKKVAFDPIDRGNNFSPLNPPFGTVGRQTISDSRSEKDFYFHANVDVTALIGSYPANTPVLARVRFLYNNIDSPIAVTAAGTIPTEGSLIESIGQTSSGVTRRLQAVRLYPPPLPIPFDYVLFSKGDIIK